MQRPVNVNTVECSHQPRDEGTTNTSIRNMGRQKQVEQLVTAHKRQQVIGPRNAPTTSLPCLATEEEPLGFYQALLGFRRESVQGEKSTYKHRLPHSNQGRGPPSSLDCLDCVLGGWGVMGTSAGSSGLCTSSDIIDGWYLATCWFFRSLSYLKTASDKPCPPPGTTFCG